MVGWFKTYSHSTLLSIARVDVYGIEGLSHALSLFLWWCFFRRGIERRGHRAGCGLRARIRRYSSELGRRPRRREACVRLIHAVGAAERKANALIHRGME